MDFLSYRKVSWKIKRNIYKLLIVTETPPVKADAADAAGVRFSPWWTKALHFMYTAWMIRALRSL